MEHLLAIALLLTCASASLEPQVAFRCGKPSVYLSLEGQSRAGWVRDSEQGCVDRLEDVLAFCKRVYPKMAANFSGVVPSANVIQIHNWCDFKQKRCESRSHNIHLVRPFKCLTTSFVPVALLVPNKCSFGHVFSPAVNQRCRPLSGWKEEAVAQCKVRVNRTELFSMGVLTPCPGDSNDVGVDQQYAGVEFVCCPVSVERSSAPQGYVVNNAEKFNHRSVHKDAIQSNDDFLAARISLKEEERTNELKLENTYRDAMKKLDKMKDTYTVAELKEQVKTRFAEKFEQTLSDEIAKWRSLEINHGQELSKQTSRQLEEVRATFTAALLKENVEISDLWPSLKKFVSLVMRAKLRALSRFSQLIVNDPVEAARDRQTLNGEFTRLNNNMQDILNEMDRVPALKEKLKQKVQALSDKYGNLDMSKNILLGTSINTEGEGGKPKLQRDGEARMKAIIARYDHAGKVLMTRRKAVVFAHDPVSSSSEKKPLQHMAYHHMKAQAEPYTPAIQDGYQVGSIVGGVVAGMALLLLVVVVVLAVRHQQERPHGGYVMSVVELSPDDEQAICPGAPVAHRVGDERHLANMQINGYENPTYKFFEKQ